MIAALWSGRKIMAEPKKKSSSTRSGNRKAGKKSIVKGLSICIKCKQKKTLSSCLHELWFD